MNRKRDAFGHAISRAIERWCVEPFQWGSGDCLISLADIVREARGYDPAAPFRGRYVTMRGALRVTRVYGGFAGALEEMALQCRWRPLICPRGALVGDIGLLNGAGRSACGVIRYYDGFWVGRTERGFAAVPVDRVSMVWRVR